MAQDVVLVCVTPQAACTKLIAAGARLAQEANAMLQILCVLPGCQGRIPDLSALEALQETAKEANAPMQVYYNDEPALTTAAHAAKYGVTHLVVGFPGERSNDFVHMVHNFIPHIPITMVGQEGKLHLMEVAAPQRV